MALTMTLPASQKFLANHKVTMYDHDPANATVNTDIGWVDMQDYSEITVFVMTSVLGGNGVTGFTLSANTTSAGGGDEEILKTHAVGDAPDAVGDWLVLSLTSEEIAAASGEDDVRYRWVSAQVDCHHTGDEAVVVYVRTAKHAKLNLTADTVS